MKRRGALGPRHPAPGAALLHPLTLAALFTLLLNDHVLKHVWPGALSGKLSDFAGMLLLPVLLHALSELCLARLRGGPPPALVCNRALAACVLVAAVLFTLPELWQPGEALYRYGLGAARYPFRALAALARGQDWPSLRPVRATADPSDLLALPMGLVAAWIARRTPQVSAVSHSA